MSKMGKTGNIILAVVVFLIVSFSIGSIVEKNMRDRESKILEKSTWQYDFSSSKVSGIPSDIEAYFKQAMTMEKAKGYKLELITLLGTQTVSGTNYLYFAKGSNGDSPNSFYIVKVYVNSAKKVELQSINLFTIEKYADKDIVSDDKVKDGGWSVYNRTKENLLPNEVKKVYELAIRKYTTIVFKPISYLGDRLFMGHDYAILAIGTKTTVDPIPSIYMITIYKDTDENAKVGKVAYIDLANYE